MMSIHFDYKQSNFRWLVLGIATWTQASATLVTYGVGPLAAFWQNDFGLSQTQSGLLISAVNIGPLLSMLFIGRALDKYGERWLISLGSICLGVTMFFVSMINRYIPLLILLSLVGISYGTAQPGGSKVIFKWFSPQERGLAMGIRQSGIPIGGTLAGVMIPFISIHFHWSLAVIIQAILAILGGLLFLVLYKEPEVVSKKNSEYQFYKQLTKLIKNRKLSPLLFTGFTLVSLQMILVGHLMTYLSKETNISLIIAGQLFSVTLFSGMTGRILLAWLSDKAWKGNRVKPLQFALCGSLIGVLILAFLPNQVPIWFLFVLCSWLGFFGIGWYSLFIVQVAETAKDNTVGLTVSYALTLNQIAIILAPAVFGLLVDWQNTYFLAWMSVSIFLLLSGVWLFFGYKNEEQEDMGARDGHGAVSSNIKFQQEKMEEKEQQKLVLISNLYEETIYIKKLLQNTEDITRDCYHLYKNLKYNFCSIKANELAQKALTIAGQVHEIKKDNQRIYARLSKVISNETLTDYMSIEELGRIIVRTNQKLARLLGKEIQFLLYVEGSHPLYHVYTILSLINNLVSNAIESIKDVGTIIISICKDGEWVEFRVHDDGVGISQKNQELIFKPRFTTKYDLLGKPSTGIGLSYVKEVVEMLKGEVTFRSHSEKNETVFVIRLPIHNLIDGVG